MIKDIKAIEYYKLTKEAKKYIDENREISGNYSYIKWYHLDDLKPISEYTGKEQFCLTHDNYIAERGDNPVTDCLFDMGLKQPCEIYILISW